MTEVDKIVQDIIDGRRLRGSDNLEFLSSADLTELMAGADKIRETLCGNNVELCAIINGRSGGCTEDCKFCAQSSCHGTDIEHYGFLDKETILKDCAYHEQKGVHRYSIVTAGRTLVGKDFEAACEVYREMHEKYGIALCASHGLLNEEAMQKLKDSGVEMYHENIETSRGYFPSICTTHDFEDKIKGIRAAHKVGLKVCSGGIIGMGEDFNDRIDMALTLAAEKVESIPLNVLIPIKGTALEDMKQLDEDEILRTVAMFRFICPTAYIRLAAGRNTMTDSGARAFRAGANATITGDMLTTSGNNIDQDKEMLKNMDFEI
jgi:biotin synthetase